MYSRMRGGLRGSVGVSAPYDRVAGLVGHSHAMTEWTMLGQETPPRVCVWPGRLHLRRSVKAAAYPKNGPIRQRNSSTKEFRSYIFHQDVRSISLVTSLKRLNITYAIGLRNKQPLELDENTVSGRRYSAIPSDFTSDSE